MSQGEQDFFNRLDAIDRHMGKRPKREMHPMAADADAMLRSAYYPPGSEHHFDVHEAASAAIASLMHLADHHGVDFKDWYEYAKDQHL